jgi:protein transport protein SEC20
MKMFIKGWTGVFTAMGIIGGSTTVSNVNSIAKSQTIIHSSATRGPRPTVSGARAPSVNVGGGGRGAPVRRSDTPPSSIPERSDQSVSEQVGRIIDESQDEPVTEQSKDGKYDEETSQERVNEAENQPNPKKRMWEESVEAQKEVQRKKDEL